MAYGCGKKIEVFNGRRMVETTCGTQSVTFAEGTAYCDKCKREMHRRYPQGWKYYPGDVCKHGNYVGGCGEDFMCPACENGD